MINIISNKNPIIYGLEGLEVSKEERFFFQRIQPVGFILFARNIANKTQTKALVESLKEISGENSMILIDQEGGRVARLNKKHWPVFPPVAHFGKIYQQNPQKAKKSCFDNFVEIGKNLAELGINVNCAPMIDLLHFDSDNIIGDRSFGEDVEVVSILGQVAIDGMAKCGVQSIIKHIPGHGRARCDSHLDLPIISENLETLVETDFKVFENLKSAPIAMTAHIIFEAIDNLPVTISKKTIDFIRQKIGFKNLLITDDLSMKALSGSLRDNSKKAIDAGCDILLHCNGIMDEMQEISEIFDK
ncbi:beta-N-acetylhexosaminidase [Flavobacteriaceae bacterium]|nr:beta-N-acetylhexosaminidase [Flavobacteriaceae bacterium]